MVGSGGSDEDSDESERGKVRSAKKKRREMSAAATGFKEHESAHLTREEYAVYHG